MDVSVHGLASSRRLIPHLRSTIVYGKINEDYSWVEAIEINKVVSSAATGFLRRFCQIPSDFHFCVFHNNNILTEQVLHPCVQPPNFEDHALVFISPSDRVAQLYPRAPSSRTTRRATVEVLEPASTPGRKLSRSTYTIIVQKRLNALEQRDRKYSRIISGSEKSWDKWGTIYCGGGKKSIKVPAYCLKLGHDRFFPHHTQSDQSPAVRPSALWVT
jgi:hypothetical protein